MSEQHDTEFSLAVERYLDEHGDDNGWWIRAKALAAEFEVAPSTVGRWARGTASPHPRLQKKILKWIEEQA